MELQQAKIRRNEEETAVSPVIATILMVAITVVLAGVLYVWANSLATPRMLMMRQAQVLKIH
ncbi:MAG: hypothetical protein CXT67_03445 [Methanobacteriota archaeon]|nr:MAG: hypothetical protein CXT67_03445 [Euryarchaeota archaeon]